MPGFDLHENVPCFPTILAVWDCFVHKTHFTDSVINFPNSRLLTRTVTPRWSYQINADFLEQTMLAALPCSHCSGSSSTRLSASYSTPFAVSCEAENNQLVAESEVDLNSAWNQRDLPSVSHQPNSTQTYLYFKNHKYLQIVYTNTISTYHVWPRTLGSVRRASFFMRDWKRHKSGVEQGLMAKELIWR